jgi:hypothetical protein
MENKTLDLNIDNYELDDILNLFHLTHDFGEIELKRAKDIVLKTHPDKSKLSSEYFIFYSKAYKVLYSIYCFKNKTVKSKNLEIQEYNPFDEDKKEQLNEFFNKNQDLKNDKNNFNKWFNEQFEKNFSAETHGYDDWLNQPDDPQNNIVAGSLGEAMSQIDKRKKEMSQLVVKTNPENYAFQSFSSSGFSNLDSDNVQDFSSDMYSNLSYQDLKKAHTTDTIIPVTQDDCKTDGFDCETINQYIGFREQQNVKPLSAEETHALLKKREKEMEVETTERAYKLAMQLEETQNKIQKF